MSRILFVERASSLNCCMCLWVCVCIQISLHSSLLEQLGQEELNLHFPWVTAFKKEFLRNILENMHIGILADQ